MPEEGRVVLLVVSPRTAPGLLAWPAWQALRAADLVLAVDLDPAWGFALADAGVDVEDVTAQAVGHRAGYLVEAAAKGCLVVWFGSPDGDPGLTDALAEHLSRRAVAAAPPEIEIVTGSHDVEGARLLDLVVVMDRLRSPGGCPWDAEQTHESLMPYLLEETHEVLEAVESGDRAHLREELGDLLLQVMFHARLAQEDERDPFGVDDVAAGIVAKLVHRHPHVFAEPQAGDVERPDAAGVASNWETIKAAEKGRTGVFDGIPLTLPALARAQKMLDRLERAGNDCAQARDDAAGDDVLASTLLAAVAQAAGQGQDAESVLRAALGRLAERHGG